MIKRANRIHYSSIPSISFIISRDKINKIAALKPLSKCKNHFHPFAQRDPKMKRVAVGTMVSAIRFEELLQMFRGYENFSV